MAQHHNTVFYDQGIAWQVDTNSGNKFYWYYHLLQTLKDFLYDKFHLPEDEANRTYPIISMNKEWLIIIKQITLVYKNYQHRTIYRY